MKFSITDSFSKCDQIPADLVTFTEQIRNGKLQFLCRVISYVVRQWNKLRTEIHNSASHQQFRKSLLSFIKPTCIILFSIHGTVGVKMLVTLRLGFSHLREHRFRHNFHDTLNPLFLAATSLKQLHTIFCAVITFLLLVQFLWTLVSVNSMKLLYQIYFYEEKIQRKVHHRIATFSRVLSNIYLQQDGLMNHSFIGHTYIHDL